ncbi:MAG: ice-binding family protein, partial [Thermoguttaceae bacterium]
TSPLYPTDSFVTGATRPGLTKNSTTTGKRGHHGRIMCKSRTQLTGTLTLDAQGSNNAFWVFQIGSALTTASGSSVVVINFGSNGGSDDGVFWQVGSSATLGTSTSFEGNILALASITLNTTATILNGRALAQTGAVTMDTNVISNVCPVGGPGNGGPGYSGGLKYDTSGHIVPDSATSSIISGVKFNDLNGNGIKQPGDPGLSGFTIFLDANNNGVLNAGEKSTVTDANGNYSFANLGPGTYRVREVQQTGFTQTTANPAAITLTTGQIVSGVEFGNFRMISISGNKFQDTNGNGVRNSGERGLQGFTIYIDANNNHVLDPGERSTTTDANGNYSFANVGPGTIRVREVAKSGFVQMTNDPASIAATSGTNVTGVLFGNMPVANLATVSKLLFTGRNLTNLLNGTFSNQANFVANLYETSLGRAPTVAELTYYLRLLQAGYTQQQVTAMFRTNVRR